MSNSNNHFAPTPVKLGRTMPRSPTLVCVSALAGVPGWVRETFGNRVLNDANRAAMLDMERIEDQDCFIPHSALSAFSETVARKSGCPNPGIVLAPSLDFSSYGVWSDYVLGARTLGGAIRRARHSIAYHSFGDQMSLTVANGIASFGYQNAAQGFSGYQQVSAGTIGVMLSLCRHYLGIGWRPDQIEFDLPKPDDAFDYEDVLQAPIVFERPTLALVFDASHLASSTHEQPDVATTTIEDVARARLAPESRDSLIGAVTHHIRCQVLSRRTSIEYTAQALDISVRSLQRELNAAGRSFRDMVNETRVSRAAELLRDSQLSVDAISNALGYSSSAHFARAFRREIGSSPMAFRSKFRGGFGANAG